MSSTSGESDVSATHTIKASYESERDGKLPASERRGSEVTNAPSIKDILAEEQQHVAEEAATGANDRTFDGYGKVKGVETTERRNEPTSPLQLPASPGESMSTPDDTPSLQVNNLHFTLTSNVF